jgi:hypothetical protein
MRDLRLGTIFLPIFRHSCNRLSCIPDSFKIHKRPPQADSGFLQVVVIGNDSAISFCSYPVDLRAESFPMNANDYTELEWAEACGVSRYLIRISVGLEDPKDIWLRLTQALEETA